MLLPPEILEPIGRQFGVAHRVLDGAMPKPVVNGSGVVSGVSQRVTAAMPQHVGKPAQRRSRAGSLFDIAVGIELFEVGPKVVDLLIVLDAGENHFRARDFSLGILDVLLEGRLIPDDARILVGIGILVIRDATGLAAVQAILCRTDLVLRARADAMADHTFLE